MVATIGSMLFFGEMFTFFLSFIFVFAITYAVLWKSGFLSDRPDINAIVAFAFAMMASLAGIAGFLTTILPYFLMLFLVIFLVFFLGKFAGMDMDAMFKNKWVLWSILIIFVSIILFVGWNEYSQNFMDKVEASNATETTGLNKTGNPFVDMANVYNYNCVEQKVFMRSLSGVSIVCMILNPRILGAIIVLLATAIIAFVVQYEKK